MQYTLFTRSIGSGGHTPLEYEQEPQPPLPKKSPMAVPGEKIGAKRKV